MSDIDILVSEVGPRDGLQSIDAVMPTGSPEESTVVTIVTPVAKLDSASRRARVSIAGSVMSVSFFTSTHPMEQALTRGASFTDLL